MTESLLTDLKNNGEVYLRIKVRPSAAESKIIGVLADETMKINIAAPAERGKANIELMKFLAKEFAVRKENVKIISGTSDRIKLVKIKK
jgi:uncharacterized protein